VQRFAAFRRLVRPEPLLHQQYAEAMDISGARLQSLRFRHRYLLC